MDHIDKLKENFTTTDRYARMLGIELLEISPGFARVGMAVSDDMSNFHGITHGGAVFSLADSAFGLASNAHGIPAVALTVSIDYLAMTVPGDYLIAVAEEVQRSRKVSNYNIKVLNREEKLVAAMRGITYLKS
ncbi:MAG: hydroxyphenylacetyl-CoA thioesterase PaaI [Deltaproteobacteria bacterium]